MNIIQQNIRPPRITIPALAVYALILIGLMLVGRGSWAQQVETTAQCDEGNIAEPVALEYSNSTENCAIGTSGTDTDRFFFSGTAGDQIRLTLVTLNNNLDPFVEVRDAANMLIDSTSCVSASNTRCSTRLDLTLPSSGDYLIIVTDQGADNSGGYILGLDGIVPDPSVTQIVYDASLSDTVNPLTDTDYFHFEATAGTALTFTLVTSTNDLDPRVEIRDPNNALVVNGAADGASCNSASNTRCSFRIDLTPMLSGTYSLHLYDNDAFNVGTYNFSLWCAYGPCPDAPTPAPGGPEILYDTVVADSIESVADGDFYAFDTNAGAELRFNFVTINNDLDPRIQVRDPSGTLVIDGTADGAGCNSASNTRCSFSFLMTPAQTGTYAVQIFDNDGFNTGGYRMSLWCEFGDCGGATTPDPEGQSIYFVPTTADTIEPIADGNFWSFNATADTSLRFNLATLTNDLDPRVQIRDPQGTLVIDGSADGASCNSASNTRCSFSVNLVPAMSGTYSVQIFDNDSFNSGSYQMGLWCILGECDGDGDAFIDGDREVLSYGVTASDNAIDSLADADFYEFMGTPGDEIRITVAGQTLNLDPRIEVRDPNGVLVEDGTGSTGCNSASNTVCSFAYTLEPAVLGTYSVVFYDDDSFNSGDYDITLECLFGTGPGFTCADLPLPPLLCADNCSSVANGDQRDSNADGFGNLCDADLNGDLIVNAVDLGLMRLVFFTGDEDADLNGDGVVNVVDLGLMRVAFFNPPGPSCAYPNLP